MTWVLLYVAALAVLGLWNFRRGRLDSLEGFVAWDRRAGAGTISLSLLSLVFGASAVFGMAGYAYRLGMNAVWWTLSGMIGLVLLRYTFVDTLVDLKGYTVSDLVGRVFGENLRGAVSAATAAAWLMVLSGQIVAGGNVLGHFVGNETAAYALFTASFAAYTLLVGQAGAMRTGPFQTLLMAAGLVLLLGACLAARPEGAAPISLRMGFDDSFTPSTLAGIAVPVGLSYLFGPDIFSRIFTARDRGAARRGLLLAVAGMAFLSVVIVLVGMAGRTLLGGAVEKPDALLPLLVQKLLSGWVGELVVLSLVSIPLSGADVILLTIGTLLGKDLAAPAARSGGVAVGERGEVTAVRLATAFGAVASLLVALRLKAILPSLLVAYKIFSVSVVPLVFASLLCLRRGRTVASPAVRSAVGAYLALSAAAVLLAELKLLPVTLPKSYSLWFLGGNALFFLAVALLASAPEGAAAAGGEEGEA